MTNVRFSAKDDYIITTGGNDLSVFVWNTDIYDEVDQGQEEEKEQIEEVHPDIPTSIVKTNLVKENK